MNYKLKNMNGKVAFLLRTGNDMVRNYMAIASAQHIINNGTIKKSYIKDYSICVDDKWYFEGKIMKRATPRKETDITSQNEDESAPQKGEVE